MPVQFSEDKVNSSEKDDLLVDGFLEFLVVEKNAAPRTISNYSHALKEV